MTGLQFVLCFTILFVAIPTVCCFDFSGRLHLEKPNHVDHFFHSFHPRSFIEKGKTYHFDVTEADRNGNPIRMKLTQTSKLNIVNIDFHHDVVDFVRSSDDRIFIRCSDVASLLPIFTENTVISTSLNWFGLDKEDASPLNFLITAPLGKLLDNSYIELNVIPIEVADLWHSFEMEGFYVASSGDKPSTAPYEGQLSTVDPTDNSIFPIPAFSYTNEGDSVVPGSQLKCALCQFNIISFVVTYEFRFHATSPDNLANVIKFELAKDVRYSMELFSDDLFAVPESFALTTLLSQDLPEVSLSGSGVGFYFGTSVRYGVASSFSGPVFTQNPYSLSITNSIKALKSAGKSKFAFTGDASRKYSNGGAVSFDVGEVDDLVADLDIVLESQLAIDVIFYGLPATSYFDDGKPSFSITDKYKFELSAKKCDYGIEVTKAEASSLLQIIAFSWQDLTSKQNQEKTFRQWGSNSIGVPLGCMQIPPRFDISDLTIDFFLKTTTDYQIVESFTSYNLTSGEWGLQVNVTDVKNSFSDAKFFMSLFTDEITFDFVDCGRSELFNEPSICVFDDSEFPSISISVEDIDASDFIYIRFNTDVPLEMYSYVYLEDPRLLGAPISIPFIGADDTFEITFEVDSPSVMVYCEADSGDPDIYVYDVDFNIIQEFYEVGTTESGVMNVEVEIPDFISIDLYAFGVPLSNLQCTFYPLFEGAGGVFPFEDSPSQNARYIIAPNFDVSEYLITNENNVDMILKYVDDIKEFDSAPIDLSGITLSYIIEDLPFNTTFKIGIIEVLGPLDTVTITNIIELEQNELIPFTLTDIDDGIQLNGYSFSYSVTPNFDSTSLLIVDIYVDNLDELSVTNSNSNYITLDCYYYNIGNCYFAVLDSELENDEFNFRIDLVDFTLNEGYLFAYEILELTDIGISNHVIQSGEELYYSYSLSSQFASSGVSFTVTVLSGDISFSVYNSNNDFFFYSAVDTVSTFGSQGDDISLSIYGSGTYSISVGALNPASISISSNSNSFTDLQRGEFSFTIDISNTQYQLNSSLFLGDTTFIEELLQSITSTDPIWNNDILPVLLANLDTAVSYISAFELLVSVPPITITGTPSNNFCIDITPPSYWIIPSVTVTSNSLCISCDTNSCGTPCGTCSTDFVCQNFECISNSCTPNCSGRECGDDGCAGTCGSCSNGFFCNNNFSCESTCTPNCSGRECGDDGCAGACGSCSTGLTCNNFVCELNTCTPNCSGRECGSDGCGGNCGSCSDDLTCSSNICVEGGFTTINYTTVISDEDDELLDDDNDFISLSLGTTEQIFSQTFIEAFSSSSDGVALRLFSLLLLLCIAINI